MRKFVLAAAAVAALMTTVPASAQYFFSNDPAAGDGSDAAALPGYGANRGIYFGYAPIGSDHNQAVTSRGHAAAKSTSKSASKSDSASDY